ncbi:TetR/AcrR family transcriptional regulator [Actinomycetospora lutea]|uniref:TetR/AcrR family transcriptional regulator n=1 Tax=Actinomycetospora lutea TaxID=663604 RepID=UPI0023659435|nr:TetR/AcrR family transcriptional regulator [Actinomycetospora lutea]MDD7942772.1 TetR/AcrR family transcriptional regulator [Actinomycetospora lutea]
MGAWEAREAREARDEHRAVPDGFWGPRTTPAARALLDSAVRCFADLGYHATTTRHITAGVGLSPGALYVHFASKEELLYEITRTGHERALEALVAAPGEGDAREHVRRLVAALVTWHARHHTVARVCQYELAALDPQHRATVLDLRARFTATLRAAVERGAAEGLFDVPDVNRALRAIMSLGIDLVRWYRLDGADSPEFLGECYAELALRMIDAPGLSAPRPPGP